MNDTPEIHRLTRAIATLATVLIESAAAAVRDQLSPPQLQSSVAAPPSSIVAAALQKPARPWLNKKELASQLNVSVRTVDNMVRDRRVSYVKIGRTVRFMWPDVEDDLKCRFRVAARKF